MASTSANPWDAAYELGLDERENLGELAPHWVYPWPGEIIQVFRSRSAQMPPDTDASRMTWRFTTFGQPRQEDLLEILKRRGVQHDPERADELRLRLHPPTNSGVPPERMR